MAFTKQLRCSIALMAAPNYHLTQNYSLNNQVFYGFLIPSLDTPKAWLCSLQFRPYFGFTGTMSTPALLLNNCVLTCTSAFALLNLYQYLCLPSSVPPRTLHTRATPLKQPICSKQGRVTLEGHVASAPLQWYPSVPLYTNLLSVGEVNLAATWKRSYLE